MDEGGGYASFMCATAAPKPRRIWGFDNFGCARLLTVLAVLTMISNPASVLAQFFPTAETRSALSDPCP